MLPTVTIITPYTASRAVQMYRLDKMLFAQDYKGPIHRVQDPREGVPIGTKRNDLCERAQGEIILHFDDDDFYSKDWVSKSVAHLLQTGAEVTGLTKAWFINEADNTLAAFDYGICKPQFPLVIGATLCYTKEYWQKNPFRHIQEGEDGLFLWKPGVNVSPHPHEKDFLATTHDNNTSRRDIRHHGWVIDPAVTLQDFNHLF